MSWLRIWEEKVSADKSCVLICTGDTFALTLSVGKCSGIHIGVLDSFFTQGLVNILDAPYTWVQTTVVYNYHQFFTLIFFYFIIYSHRCINNFFQLYLMVVIQIAICGIIEKHQGLRLIHALKQHRPELEDHPSLLKFSQEASSLTHAVESMLKIATENSP